MTRPATDPGLRHVLIVEDGRDCARMLETALSVIPGIALHLFASAEDALSALTETAFSAMITDINLPRMDGIELTSRLRATERFRTLPVLVVSGDTDPAAPQRALLAGANAFFPKPFSPSAVRKTLEELLNAH